MHRNPPPPPARPTSVAAPLPNPLEQDLTRVTLPIADVIDVESYTKMVPADTLRWSLVSIRLGLRISVAALAVLTGIPYAMGPALMKASPSRISSSIPRSSRSVPANSRRCCRSVPASPCAPWNLQDAIQRLYATGEYADIAVDATLEPERRDPEIRDQTGLFHRKRSSEWRAGTSQRGPVGSGDEIGIGHRILSRTIKARGGSPGGRDEAQWFL